MVILIADAGLRQGRWLWKMKFAGFRRVLRTIHTTSVKEECLAKSGKDSNNIAKAIKMVG